MWLAVNFVSWDSIECESLSRYGNSTRVFVEESVCYKDLTTIDNDTRSTTSYSLDCETKTNHRYLRNEFQMNSSRMTISVELSRLV